MWRNIWLPPPREAEKQAPLPQIFSHNITDFPLESFGPFWQVLERLFIPLYIMSGRFALLKMHYCHNSPHCFDKNVNLHEHVKIIAYFACFSAYIFVDFDY